MTDFGINMFPTDKAIDPMTLAKEAEDRGFESIWFPEHSHIPTSRETPWGLKSQSTTVAGRILAHTRSVRGLGNGWSCDEHNQTRHRYYVGAPT